MEERTTGIVLRTRPLTETSLIVQWLTPDFGRLSTVAKGARRAKSPFLGKLDLFFVADFTFYRSRRSELHTLREVKVRDFHPELRLDLPSLRQAAYFTLLLEQTTESGTPLPGLYQLLTDALAAISARVPSQARTIPVLSFELKLLVELGLAAEQQKTGLSAPAQRLFEQLAGRNWTAHSQIEAGLEEIEELAAYMESVLVYQLGRVPKGRREALGAGGS